MPRPTTPSLADPSAAGVACAAPATCGYCAGPAGPDAVLLRCMRCRAARHEGCVGRREDGSGPLVGFVCGGCRPPAFAGPALPQDIFRVVPAARGARDANAAATDALEPRGCLQAYIAASLRTTRGARAAGNVKKAAPKRGGRVVRGSPVPQGATTPGGATAGTPAAAAAAAAGRGRHSAPAVAALATPAAAGTDAGAPDGGFMDATPQPPPALSPPPPASDSAVETTPADAAADSGAALSMFTPGRTVDAVIDGDCHQAVVDSVDEAQNKVIVKFPTVGSTRTRKKYSTAAVDPMHVRLTDGGDEGA